MQKDGGKMADMRKLMKKMQKMQEKMEKIQDGLADEEVEATAGGGMVEVRVNGKQEILEINISDEVVDPDDVEMLEDLVVAAVNKAMEKSNDLVSDKMGSLTQGLPNIPGLT